MLMALLSGIFIVSIFNKQRRIAEDLIKDRQEEPLMGAIAVSPEVFSLQPVMGKVAVSAGRTNR
jgi:hypothetical protein